MRSVKCVAILASLFSAAVAHAADPIFFDSFEHASANWYTIDGGDVAITSDADACTTSYVHETVPFSGGRVLTNYIDVTGGGEYCLSAFVRASSDATAYVAFDGTWLFGSDGYPVVINADGAWHWYAASLTLDPSTTQTQVGFELGSGTSADFDDIAVTPGPCANAYAGADQHQTCSGDTPVCSADGSCQAATPPDDMGGGPSSTPDMGGAPVSTFPGSNQALTPSTPVAAEGTPSGTGPVREGGSGGCSVGGTASERSFAVMLLAFVAVMLAARRRRA